MQTNTPSFCFADAEPEQTTKDKLAMPTGYEEQQQQKSDTTRKVLYRTMTSVNTNTNTCMQPEQKHSGSLADWDDPHLLFPAPRPALPLLGRWFSCCVPKKSEEPPKLSFSATDQDETERTDLEEEDENEEDSLRMMDSFLDAVDLDVSTPADVLQSNSNNNNNSSNNNKSARINNLAQEILQTLLGIFMINYFIEAFRPKGPPKRILAETNDSTERTSR